MTETLTLPGADAGGRARATSGSPAGRLAVLLYGATAYVLFLGTFLYMIGFVAGAIVPKHVDSGAAAPLWTALAVNGSLLALFAVQHAIMARPAFKRRWTRIVPRVVERSTFVLATCLVLGLMVWQWRAMPGVVWQVEGAAAVALWCLSAAGWAIVLVSTFLIDHFELFGLRQVVLHFRQREDAGPQFHERMFYKVVRHPLMLGFLIAFWATPVMTAGHLFFALMCTGYILVGIRMEERDLVDAHGEDYLDYRRRVRGLLPLPRRAG